MTINLNTSYTLDANNLTYLGERDYLLKAAGTGSGLTFDTHPATLYDRRISRHLSISRHLRREPWPDRSGLNLLVRFITLCITEVLHCNIPALSNSRFCQNTADILFCPQPLNTLLD